MKHRATNVARVEQTCIGVKCNEGSEEGHVSIGINRDVGEAAARPPRFHTPRKMNEKKDA